MGEIIGIRERIAPQKFRIQFTTTGEERTVEVDPDKENLFSAKGPGTSRPGACPFLREKSPGTHICTVHSSRPELCRQYACFRILVCDRDGKRLGRVWDASRYFTTTDPLLRELWNREISGREIVDDTVWEDFVGQVLIGKGYHVIR
jgi:uncharacterized protein